MMTEEVDECAAPKRHKTLLEKYEIPLDHLDFDYVKKCDDVKEIEKIVKILKSQEEGHYPDLLKCACEKLKSLAPDHRLLREVVPCLKKDSLPSSEWNELMGDIMTWKEEIGEKEKDLSNKKVIFDNKDCYPPVRCAGNLENNKPPPKVSKPIISSYDKWDKFDADAECLKIDLEEEKKREEKEKKEREEMLKKKEELRLSQEEKEMKEIQKIVAGMTEVEKEVYAKKEKDLGNECYQANEFNAAIRHYTRSIAISPSPPAYNNRAATYLKQCRYSLALHDTNKVLEVQPKNVKALFRRALAYQHKNDFHRALDDIREVLKVEPHHVIARHVAEQLREHCKSEPKKVKLMIKDETENKDSEFKMIEVTEEEMLTKYKNKNFVQVNDLGLPKIMCNCNGKYVNDPAIRHDHRMRYQHMRKHQNKVKPVINEVAPKSTPHAKVLNDSIPPPNPLPGAKRIPILELSKITEQEDKEEGKAATAVHTGKLTKEASNKTNAMKSRKEADVNHQATPQFTSEPSTSQFNGGGDCKMDGMKEKTPLSQQSSSEDHPAPSNEKKAKLEKTKSNEKKRQARTEREEVSDPFPGFASPVKVQVADKYIQKVSQPASTAKGSKREATPPKESPLQEERVKAVSPEHSLSMSPYHFAQSWAALRNTQDHLAAKAKLLRSVRPHLLQAVIGNKLDDDMLSDIISCLHRHFNLNNEKELIAEYLNAITQLERFKIINSFLSSENKKLVKGLLDNLGSTINTKVKEMYA